MREREREYSEENIEKEMEKLGFKKIRAKSISTVSSLIELIKLSFCLIMINELLTGKISIKFPKVKGSRALTRVRTFSMVDTSFKFISRKIK